MIGYTIISAKQSGGAVIIQTQESGAVAVTESDRPALWAHLQEWVANGGNIEQQTQAEIDRLAAMARIMELEAQITPRRIRDAILGVENPAGWLGTQESLISAERAKL